MHDLFLKGDAWCMDDALFTSIQVNIDFTDSEDAGQMAFIADAIQPLVSIMFSNSFYEWRTGENLDGRYGKIQITHVRYFIQHSMNDVDQIVDKYTEWLLTKDTIFLDNMDDTGVFVVEALEI